MPHMLGQITNDLPIRPRRARRVHQLANPLDTAFGVHEAAVFFETGCSGQQDMSEPLCRLGFEKVDDDDQVNIRQRPGGFTLVCKSSGDVIADHDQRLEFVCGSGIHHLHEMEPLFLR